MEQVIKSQNEYGIPSNLLTPCSEIIAAHTFVTMSDLSTLYHLSPSSFENQLSLFQEHSTYTEVQWAVIMEALHADSGSINRQRAIIEAIDEAARASKEFNHLAEGFSSDYSLLFYYSGILFSNPAVICERCSVFKQFVDTLFEKQVLATFWLIQSDSMRNIFEHLILTVDLDIPLLTHWVMAYYLTDRSDEINYFIELIKAKNPFIFAFSQSNFAKIISNTDIKEITCQSLNELYNQINPPLEWVQIDINSNSEIKPSPPENVDPLSRAFMEPYQDKQPATITKPAATVAKPTAPEVQTSMVPMPKHNKTLKPLKSCFKKKFPVIQPMIDFLWTICLLTPYLFFRKIILLTLGKHTRLTFSPGTTFPEKPYKRNRKSFRTKKNDSAHNARLTTDRTSRVVFSGTSTVTTKNPSKKQNPH